MSLHLKKYSAESKPKRITQKKTLYIFIAGFGAIGQTLSRQIHASNHPLFDLHILGICNSRFTQWNPASSVFQKQKALNKGIATDWERITQELEEYKEDHLIFVDATGSEDVAKWYEYLLGQGIHIATPSKRANTLSQEYFDRLKEITNSTRAEYRYETSVGAGLPIIQTLNTLLNSGDEITKISGVASGTMTYLFNQLQLGNSFSEAVSSAKTSGYSEPDPRDDLSGEDVARKFLILARTCGYTFERKQVRVDSLVPEKLINLSINDFLSELPSYDDHWNGRHSQALVNNRRLRYVGKFSAEGITVGVEEVQADSPLGGLKGTDNLLQIHTRRYAESPIVIQGPGAGKEVTAAGVLGDIIDIGLVI